ncbi:MAG: spermidine/putrescine ABC transporter substrate-binding protein [Verrucomicrobia bacterium]|nr:spermidine/putrescine ABC transporter substrate-binding protein [Verrucomicrobiota bacterium]MBS0636753.1 spermidine/putrescine ABC transporter substrate-binding protein [Verrucomicrobiota bacterium]
MRYLILLCLLFTSCGSKKPELHVYSWADYIKPEIVEQFEEKFGCRVVIDTFDSNESMFAKLRLGATGYDIIVPSNYFVEVMQQADMLQPINKEALPNLKYINPAIFKLVDKESFRMGVPYMMTPTGLAWRKDKLESFESSWAVFANEALRGRMTMLNDPREAIGAALKYRGYSVNTKNGEELQAAKEQLLLWKRNLAKFESEQYKNGIASGEYIVVQGYSGDILQVIQENDNVGFSLPKEGSTSSIDFLVIPKQAEKVALAHEFINFLYEPQVAAANMNFTCYLCPNTEGLKLVDDRLKGLFQQFLTEESLNKIEVIHDLGSYNNAYNKVWDEVKSL